MLLCHTAFPACCLRGKSWVTSPTRQDVLPHPHLQASISGDELREALPGTLAFTAALGESTACSAPSEDEQEEPNHMHAA